MPKVFEVDLATALLHWGHHDAEPFAEAHLADLHVRTLERVEVPNGHVALFLVAFNNFLLLRYLSA